MTQYELVMDNTRKPQLACVREFDQTGYSDDYSFNSPYVIADFLRDTLNLHNMAEEHLIMLSLDNKGHMLGIFELSKGTVNSSLAGTREAMIRALLTGATSIVIAHNHPSRYVTPSAADKSTVQAFKKACEILNISFLDSIIIGGETQFYSARGTGEI